MELNRTQLVLGGHNKEGEHTFSINLPIPDTVTDLPPKICAASSAISLPVRVIYLRGCEHELVMMWSKVQTVSVSQSCQQAYQTARHKTSMRKYGLLLSGHGLWTHIIHLVCHRLEPILGRFDPRYHSSQLGSDDCLGMQRLSKGNALI